MPEPAPVTIVPIVVPDNIGEAAASTQARDVIVAFSSEGPNVVLAHRIQRSRARLPKVRSHQSFTRLTVTQVVKR